MTKGPLKRNMRLTLRLPEEVAEALQRAADEDRRSKSDWIVVTIEAELARRAKRRKPRNG